MDGAATSSRRRERSRLPGRGHARVYDTAGGSEALAAEPAGDAATASVQQRPTLLLLHGWTSTAALNWCRCFRSALRGVPRAGARSSRPRRGYPEPSAVPPRGLRRRCRRPARADWHRTGHRRRLLHGRAVVAQLLWQRHREVVDGLVLCATAARFATRRLNGAGRHRGLPGLALALSRVPPNVRRRGLGVALRKRRAGRGLAPWVVAEWESNDPAALAQAGFALGRFDSTGWIGAVDVPTSVVITTLDVTVSPRRQWLDLKDCDPGVGRCAFPSAGDQSDGPALTSVARPSSPGLGRSLPGRTDDLGRSDLSQAGRRCGLGPDEGGLRRPGLRR